MGLDALFTEMRRRKLRVTNLYEGTDRVWRIGLRRNDREIASLHGTGTSPEAALSAALALEAGGDGMFEDLLG